jgi:type IV secretion system protein VirB9
LAAVTAKIEHDYKYKPAAIHEPFNVMAMYHDDRFTYIEAAPAEPPAVYEVKDGKDSLIQFEFDEAHHRYTIPKVLNQGYLRVGKTVLKFKREKAG